MDFALRLDDIINFGVVMPTQIPTQTPSIMTNISFSFMPTSAHSISGSINAANIAILHASMAYLRPDVVSPPPNIALDQFGTSVQQLHSYSRAQCQEACNTNVQYNPQIQCGVSNAIIGLMSEEPDMARCALELKQGCLDNCDKLNH